MCNAIKCDVGASFGDKAIERGEREGRESEKGNRERNTDK